MNEAYILLDVCDDSYKVDPLLLKPLSHEVEFVKVNLASLTLELLVLSACCRAEVVRHLPAKELAEVHQRTGLFLLKDSLALLEDLLGGRELDKVLSRQELTLAFLGVRVEEVTLLVVSLAEFQALNCEGVILFFSEDCGLRGGEDYLTLSVDAEAHPVKQITVVFKKLYLLAPKAL